MNPRAIIRPMVKSDLNRILEIESQNPYSWDDERFGSCFNSEGTIGLVIEYDNVVYGYMIYCVTSDSVIILNITIDSALRRCGLGCNLIKAIKSRVDTVRRLSIDVVVPEYDIVSQLFFKNCRFKCVSIMNGYYDEHETENDVGYLFRYQPK